MSESIEQRLEGFCNALKAYLDSKMVNTNIPDYYGSVEAQKGKKYARIVVTAYSSASSYCFVDLSNGDILKSAGWNAPAKGKRGSIFNDGFDVGDGKPCDQHGSGLYRR